MIQANKATVLTDFNLGSVSLQFMEIEYFLLVFGRITKIASLLAGFAAAALMQTASANPEYKRLHLLHVLATGGALGFMLLVLLICTFCTMWGPGLALRGCGIISVSRAVEIMDWAQQATLRFFNMGLICYLLSSLVSALLFQPPLCCIVLITIFVAAMIHLYASDYEIKHALLPKVVTRGEIKGNPLGKSAAAEENSCVSSCYAPTYQECPRTTNANFPASASSTAESLKMPGWLAMGGGYAPELNSSNGYTVNYNLNYSPERTNQPDRMSSDHAINQAMQQQQQQQQHDEGASPTLRQPASSTYTSALGTLASFLGLEGEEVESEQSPTASRDA